MKMINILIIEKSKKHSDIKFKIIVLNKAKQKHE